MKKFLSITLVMLVIFSMLTGCTKSGNKKNGNVSLKESPVSDFEYTISSTNAIIIDKYIGKDETVVIPNEIEGYEVVAINIAAFAQNKTIEKVVLPDSVKYIYDRAFAACSNLKEVVFGRNLELINYEAFENCTSLQYVNLPENLKEICYSAFYNCSSLTKIFIPKSCTKYSFTFQKCSSLKEIVFEDGANIICSDAFLAADSLETVTIPASAKEIVGVTFFEKYSNLKTIKFLGDAPKVTLGSLGEINQGLTIYYKKGTTGWEDSPLAEKFTLIAE